MLRLLVGPRTLSAAHGQVLVPRLVAVLWHGLGFVQVPWAAPVTLWVSMPGKAGQVNLLSLLFPLRVVPGGLRRHPQGLLGRWAWDQAWTPGLQSTLPCGIWAEGRLQGRTLAPASSRCPLCPWAPCLAHGFLTYYPFGLGFVFHGDSELHPVPHAESTK